MDTYIASDRATWWRDHLTLNIKLDTLVVQSADQVRPGDIVAIDYMQFGIQGMRELQNRYPLAQCIALGQDPSATETNQAFEAGMRAIWTTSMKPEEIRASYSHCASRAATIDEIMQQHGTLLLGWSRLTKKERAIIRGSLIYDSANDLAAMNHSSPRTVEAHRYNVTRKLNDGTFRDIVVRFRRLMQALYHIGIDGQRLLEMEAVTTRPKALASAT